MATEIPIILGSGSKFRKALLASTGLSFDTAVADCNEKEILATAPDLTACARAVAKAQEVSKEHPEALVIGCDQVLGFNRQVIDKVETPEEAVRRLCQLQGERHYLHSAYSLVLGGKEMRSRVVTITMDMKPLSEAEIKEYVATGEWQGCVGCYQFENKGGALFSQVDGSEDAIVGLPLEPLLADIQTVLGEI